MNKCVSGCQASPGCHWWHLKRTFARSSSELGLGFIDFAVQNDGSTMASTKDPPEDSVAAGSVSSSLSEGTEMNSDNGEEKKEAKEGQESSGKSCKPDVGIFDSKVAPNDDSNASSLKGFCETYTKARSFSVGNVRDDEEEEDSQLANEEEVKTDGDGTCLCVFAVQQ